MIITLAPTGIFFGKNEVTQGMGCKGGRHVGIRGGATRGWKRFQKYFLKLNEKVTNFEGK